MFWLHRKKLPQISFLFFYMLTQIPNSWEIKEIILLHPNCFLLCRHELFWRFVWLVISLVNRKAKKNKKTRERPRQPHTQPGKLSPSTSCVYFISEKPTIDAHAEINSDTKFITRALVWYEFFILTILKSIILWTLHFFNYAIFQAYKK